jgi:hypothetical protein
MSVRRVEVFTLQQLIDSGVIQAQNEFTSDTSKFGVTNIRSYLFTPTNKYFFLETDTPKFLYIRGTKNYLIITDPDATNPDEINNVVNLLRAGNVMAAGQYGVKLLKLIEINYDLIAATEEINELNKKLEALPLKITLNPFYEVPTSNIVASYDRKFETLLLCIYYGNTCISSIILTVNDDTIKIDSYTMADYQGRKLNVLMRAVAILLANKIKPDAESLSSLSINPISAYVLMKYFNAVPRYDKAGILELVGNVPSKIKPEDINAAMSRYSVIDLEIPLGPSDLRNAMDIFVNTVHTLERNGFSAVDSGRGGSTGHKRKRKTRTKSKRNFFKRKNTLSRKKKTNKRVYVRTT